MACVSYGDDCATCGDEAADAARYREIKPLIEDVERAAWMAEDVRRLRGKYSESYQSALNRIFDTALALAQRVVILDSKEGNQP
jgi:hypothetical protein